MFVKIVTLYAVTKVILIDIVLLVNTLMLQMLQTTLLKQKQTIYAVIVERYMNQEWVYGDIQKNVLAKYQVYLMNY